VKSGSYGDLIPVRNANSGLTVEATVVSAKTVMVKL
jgi:flagella basal body P-ring formation protein FlgA